MRTVLDEIGAGRVPELLVFNKADRRPEAKRWPSAPPARWPSRPATGEGIDELLRDRRRPAAGLAAVVELVVPYDRGDVLAAVHREGEVLVEAPARTTRVRARLDAGADASAGRLAESRSRPSRWRWPHDEASSRRRTPTTASTGSGGGRGARRRRRRPVDRHALRPAAGRRWSRRWRRPAAERGYPPRSARRRSASAAAGWMAAASASTSMPDAVAACIGTKELVAALPARGCACARPTATPCSTRPSATRPTRWAPPWPAAGPWPCRPTPTGASTSTPSIQPTRRGRCACWVNSPGNPTGRPRRPRRRGGVGPGPRRAGVQRRVLRRVHLGRAAPRTILEHGARRRGRRALALEALEPGRRPGRLLRRRRRAGRVTSARCASTPGSWCPARSRRPPRWPWATTPTSTSSGPRYRRRLERGRSTCSAAAGSCRLPGGGFYLWVAGARRRRVGRHRGSLAAEAAARQPGRALRPAGAGFVRLGPRATRRPPSSRPPNGWSPAGAGPG